jgi:hypothetical protein
VTAKPWNSVKIPPLSPDGKWIAYSQVDDIPSDIMLADHFK